jgi:hypothetical protein
MIPKGPIHIVGGQVLCAQQYADYRGEIEFLRGIEWAVKKVVEIDGKAGDDVAFRLMIKAAFLEEK